MSSFKRLKHSKAARNAAAAYFAFFSSAVSGFISISIAVSFLNKEEIGLWTAVNAMMAYLLWMDLGVGYATGRMMAEAVVAKDQHEINNWWTLTQIALWAIGVLITILGLLCIPLFIYVFKVPPNLQHDAWILLGGSAVITGLNLPLRAVTGLLTAQERFHWVSICQGAMPWVQVTGFYFMLTRGHGTTSYLWGTALSQFFVLIYYRSLVLTSAQRPRWIRHGFNRERLKTLLSYSLKMTVVNFKETILQNLPTMILARHGGLVAIPVYSITSRGPAMAGSLAIRNMHAFYPSLVNLYVVGEKELFLAKHRLMATITLSVAMCAACGVLLFNPCFVELIAGRDFYAGSNLNIWFAIATITIPMSAVYSYLLQISGNIGKGPWVAILSLVVSFPTAILAFNGFGLPGLAAVIALDPLVFGWYGFVRGARNANYKLSDFSSTPIVLSIAICLLIGLSGVAMDHLPSSGYTFTLGHKTSTLPGFYQWIIVIPMIMSAIGLGIHSMKQQSTIKGSDRAV